MGAAGTGCSCRCASAPTRPPPRAPCARAGATIVGVSPRYATTTVAVPAEKLTAVAAVSGVRSVTPVITPHTNTGLHTNTWSPETCLGATTSLGVGQMHVDQARQDYAATGAGVKVGVLSDSFDVTGSAPSAAHDVSTGDLPGAGDPCGYTTPVDVLQDDTATRTAATDDEGRAMTKIVHDVAPAATLDFATANPGEDSSSPTDIQRLKDAGAKVIVDDVSYYDEPMFQDGPVANAVHDVTTRRRSGLVLLLGGQRELPGRRGQRHRLVRDAGLPPDRLPDSSPRPVPATATARTSTRAAGPTTRSISVPTATTTLTFDLQWSEPWNGVTDDLDLYLLDSTPDQVVAKPGRNDSLTARSSPSSSSTRRGSTPPARHQAQRRLHRHAADEGHHLRLGADLPGTSDRGPGPDGDVVGPSIFSHNGAANATTVAAVPANDASAPEPYSSRGPVTLYWGPVRRDDAASRSGPRRC